MTWETRDVLMLVGAVASAAATIIAVRHQVAALARELERVTEGLRERIKALEDSRDKQGERLGALERTLAISRAVERVRRQTSSTGTGVPRGIKDGDDSGESEG